VKLHSNAKDLTQKMPAAGPGMVITLNWMCGTSAAVANLAAAIAKTDDLFAEVV